MKRSTIVTRILDIMGTRLLLWLSAPCRCAAGVSAVEFALMLPILMILLAGVLDYGAYINNVLNLNAATRGAAEWAKNNVPTSSTTVTCTSSSTDICKYGNFASGVSVTYAPLCTCVDNSAASGTCPSAATCSGSDTRVIQYVTVSATQNFSAFVPYTQLLLPTSLTATSALRVQ